jgi:hypothetical protein
LADMTPEKSAKRLALALSISDALLKELLPKIQAECTAFETDEQPEALSIIVGTITQRLALQMAKGMASGFPPGVARELKQRAIFVDFLNKCRDLGVQYQFESIAHIPVNLENPHGQLDS